MNPYVRWVCRDLIPTVGQQDVPDLGGLYAEAHSLDSFGGSRWSSAGVTLAEEAAQEPREPHRRAVVS